MAMCRTRFLLTVATILHARVVAAAAAAKTSDVPISMPPSQYFDGNDGWWSSFQIQVGTPPQTVRLFPGTSADAGTTIWVVLAEGCWEANPGLPNCPNARGYTFTRNDSTTWSTQQLANGGLYSLNTFEEGYLDLTGSAYYGFDTVNMGIAGQGLPTLQNQLVAGLGTDNYWLGSLGLSPMTFNISNLDAPIPSLLETLRNQSYVPSSSWAYTAGAFYHTPQVFGSLTFGGYDATRMVLNQTLRDVAFGSSDRDLTVQLETITYDTIGSTPLLTESIYMFIDSMVSQLWLPVEVCQGFERAFNLTWNGNASLYLIDEDVHTALVTQNPVFSFKLGSGTGTDSITIELPYAAFDLNVTLPITSSQSRYFPLQRAYNSSQYILGRVFLQAAYIIADYDRQNFTISQAAFPPTSLQQQIVPICAPDNEAACRGLGTGLSKGAIAGIVVGSIIALCLLSAGVVVFLRRRRHRERQQAGASSHNASSYPEDRKVSSGLDVIGSAKHGIYPSSEVRSELGTSENLAGRHEEYELSTGWVPNEMAAREVAARELAAKEVAAVELEAPVA